jgi:glycosyltransferase involved in cell wall biosynthesis/SAM-dependent methyltransferase
MKPSGELSEGPDDISSNCLECREVERLLPATHILRKSLSRNKKDFYRKTAETALAGRKGEHPNMALVRGMLDRTRFLREQFNSVDAILAPTKLMHKMLTTNGIDPGLVSLSPYGINLSRFDDAEPSRNGTGRVRFGYVGTIHPQKGVHLLIEAFKSLPRDMDVTLRICGSFAHFPEYSREVYELARSDPRINFAGTFPNEKITEELGKIDVLVVPSTWYENTPLVIYSAFAAKTPVVATNLGGMAEVVRHEENGLLFERGDAQDLARQLRRLMDEPDSLKRYAGNVGNVRSIEDSTNEALGLYEKLLQEKKPRDHERARKASREINDWLWLNHLGIRQNPDLSRYALALPPEELRRLPYEAASEPDFAAYGVQACRTILEAAPVPWERLPAVLDYGCGSGAVARAFKLRGVDLHGVDEDRENIAWIRSNLPHVKAVEANRDAPLPFEEQSFDAIYSMSVFTHGGEDDHKAQLADLARVAKPGAFLFLAVYGEHAFEQIGKETGVSNALGLDERLLEDVAQILGRGEYASIKQRELRSHETSNGHESHVSFVPSSCIRRDWTELFDLVDIEEGAIGDLQDLVVLRAKTVEESRIQDDEALHTEAGERGAGLAALRRARVSDHWARNVQARRGGEFAGNWLDHKAIKRHCIYPMSTGSADEDWVNYVARKYFPEPVGKALSLGCGAGGLERHALSAGICSNFDAYDISEGSIEAAREEAQKAGFLDRINYVAADLNAITLEENAYDAVFASMAIHHLENLEGVYEELTKALKPGGLFVFNEFVGPSQFQWTDTQLRFANELMKEIPEQYRITNQDTVLREIRRPTIEFMNETDPSESIRSEEIMPITERFFDIVERRDYGGTLLHLVTAAGTIRNYSSDSEEDVALLQRMIDFEKSHIAAGDLDSDFTLVIARNRGV